jgi:tyrosine-protein kinase Etk/Wzc
MSEPQELFPYEEQKTVVDPNKIIAILYRRWYIIAVSVLLSLLVAFLQLRYTKPLYTAVIKLKLEDDKPNQMSDIFKYGRTTGRFDNFLKTETEIIKSVDYAEKTLHKMNYTYSFYNKGTIVTSELYPNTFFQVENIFDDPQEGTHSFIIEYISPTEYKVLSNSNQHSNVTYSLNDTFFIGNNFLRLLPIEGRTTLPKFNQIVCSKHNIAGLAHAFAGALGIDVVKGTSLIELQITNESPQLASDYLNTFAKFYIEQTISDKSKATEQTLNFIDQQLLDLSAKVQKSEYELSDIKTKNNGIEIDEVAQNQVEKLTEYESDRNILLIKQDAMKTLQKSMTETNEGPVSFVIFDKEDAENLPDLMEGFNDLILERITLLQKNTERSAVAIANETKIKETRAIILKTLAAINNKIRDKIAFIDNRIKEVNEILSSLPMRQRMLINIQREFKVNESVYTYLFEKKLETSISKSSITANATIVQASETPISPISPNGKKAYSVALVVGLIIGVGGIALPRLLYQKIPDKETLESISTTPILGVVKEMYDPDNEYEIHTFKSPKSVFSESIRGIRTGINFIAKGHDKKVICVTSTVSGEGKTFCTINLAASFTLLDKKVIIIGCDLRRPKVHLSFSNITNQIGLSTYLIGKSGIDEIIQHSVHPNLDVITAGPTPPNPSEILQMTEMFTLIQLLKERYDYILIDSAPVGLVSDSLSIMEHADINLYIIRANYSKRDFAVIPDRLTSDSDIKNLYTVLNAYDNNAIVYSSIYKNDYGGYHSGSGYYYYGGYYGKGGYGYYGKKYNNSYYSGYYSDDEDRQSKSRSTFLNKLLSFTFKKK